MRYRLLGALDVRGDDGSNVRVTSPKRRALLAILLLQRGRPIQRSALIDALWGEASPDAATESLFAHLSRLRGELAQDAITTVPGGYLMPVRDGDLDVATFERQVAAGRRAIGDGQWFAASNALEAALQLWRGPALAEFADEPYFVPEISRLDELRISALEDRIEADLELRRHRLLIPELEQLVRLHPLRERFWGQLMVALYKSGRQSDALDRYREMRRTLRAELGIEPSPDLQTVQQRILRQDTALAGMEVAGRAVVDLPEHSTRTIGRIRELELMREAVGEHRLVTLTGPGGIGKTRLAVLAAELLAAQFPDGTQFVDLSAVRDPSHVLERIGAIVGGGGRPDVVIGHRRFLLVLDNFEQVLDAARAVGSLLVRCPNLRVIVSSRAPLRIAAEHRFEVPPLAPGEANDLFVDRAGSLPDDQIGDVVAHLDGLPLAVELAAAQAASRSLSAVRELLGDRTPNGIDRPDGGRQATLRDTIGWSYGLLSSDAQAAFRGLSVLAPGFDITAALVIGETGTNAINELVNHSLLRRVGDRYSMLETIRAFAEGVASESEATEARNRHVRHYAGLVVAARAMAAEATGSHLNGADLLMNACADNEENLRLAFERASATGDAAAIVRLLRGVGLYLLIQGRLEMGLRWAREALDRSDRLQPEELQAVRVIAAEFARFSGQGRVALALLELVLQEALELGDHRRAANTMDDMANTFSEMGLYDDANSLLQRARATHPLEASCDPRHLRHTLETEIFVLLRQGRVAEAEATSREYLHVTVSLAGWAMRNLETELALGAVAAAAGRTAAARTSFERVVRDASAGQFRGFIADALDGLAHIEREVRPDRAAMLLGMADRARAESRFSVYFAPQRAALIRRLEELLGADAYEEARRAGELVPVIDMAATVRLGQSAEGPVL